MIQFKISRGADDQWYVRAHSANGEPWLVSEGYSTKSSARRSAEDIVNAIRTGDVEVIG